MRGIMKKKECGGDGTWRWFLTFSKVGSGCRVPAAGARPGPSGAGGDVGPSRFHPDVPGAPTTEATRGRLA